MRYIILLLLYTKLGIAQSNQDVIESIGDGTQFITPCSALLLTIVNKDKKGTVKFIESFASTAISVYIIKNSVYKKRPDLSGNTSFPSGHTAISFQGAAFIQCRYGWKYGVPAYILATYTGFSRVYSNRHYFEDIIVVAAIGIGSVYLFTKPLKDPKINITYAKIKDNGFLIGLNYRF
jgi:membrane-associated phospholipid phosphatase